MRHQAAGAVCPAPSTELMILCGPTIPILIGFDVLISLVSLLKVYGVAKTCAKRQPLLIGSIPRGDGCNSLGDYD
eukprot:3095438-Amphidinium_carterae.1